MNDYIEGVIMMSDDIEGDNEEYCLRTECKWRLRFKKSKRKSVLCDY